MIELDLTKAAYNKPFPNTNGECSAYIKSKEGKSYKIRFNCSRSKEISQDWNGELMWDQVDLLRSNPALLGIEEVEAEQIYVDGLGGPDAEERRRSTEDDSRDARFLHMQMASLDPKNQLSNWNTFDKWKEQYWKREYPSYSPKTDTSKKYPPTESPVGQPGKWKPMVWRQEFPDFAPKTNDSKPKNVEESFKEKNKEQSADPKGQNGKMTVPMAKVESNHYVDFKDYAEKGFYQQIYPGLGPNSETAKAEEVTHYDGLYQQEDQAIPHRPKNVPMKFKYKIGQRKTYNDQWKLFVQAPTRLYRDFLVAKDNKKV